MDQRIRALERKLAETPDTSVGVQLLHAKLAVGDITTGDIRGAAALGCSAAIAYLGKRVAFDSQSRRFYILLGYSAIHHPDIDEMMDKLVIGDDVIEFVENCNLTFEAFFRGEQQVELSPAGRARRSPRFRAPLTIREAATYYGARGWGRPHEGISAPFLRQYFEEAAIQHHTAVLYHTVGAYETLMSAFLKSPQTRVWACLRHIVEALYWIRIRDFFPATWDFDPPNRESQHQALIDQYRNELLDEISPAAIVQLLGPYFDF
jgi:hypothetical protein